MSQNLKKLDRSCYKILNNVMLPSKGATDNTEIDHVIVSNFGIFCIETKTRKGLIVGSANEIYWRQYLGFQYWKFKNPIHQNYGHRKAIENLLISNGIRAHIVPFLIFPTADAFNISDYDDYGTTREVLARIKDFDTQVYTDQERDSIYMLIKNSNVANRKNKKLHKRQVQSLSTS